MNTSDDEIEIIWLKIDLRQIKSIGYEGIVRGVNFAKLVNALDIHYHEIKPLRDDGIVAYDTFSTLTEDVLPQWKLKFVDWVLRNSVNEIVESFFVFLELCVFYHERLDTKIFIPTGSCYKQTLFREIKRTRKKHSRYIDMKKYFDSIDPAIFSVEVDNILRGFHHLRNDSRHNMSIFRTSDGALGSKITYRWYMPEVGVQYKSGRYSEISADPIMEPATLVFKRKNLVQKSFIEGTEIKFSSEDVANIAWTFSLLIEEIAKKVFSTSEKHDG